MGGLGRKGVSYYVSTDTRSEGRQRFDTDTDGKDSVVQPGVYSNYERGDIDIPTAILIKLADFHNVSVDYLLNRTDNPKTAR